MIMSAFPFGDLQSRITPALSMNIMNAKLQDNVKINISDGSGKDSSDLIFDLDTGNLPDKDKFVISNLHGSKIKLYREDNESGKKILMLEMPISKVKENGDIVSAILFSDPTAGSGNYYSYYLETNGGDKYKSESYLCEFDSCYLADGNYSVRLFYLLDIGDISVRKNMAITEILNHPYPIAISGELGYRQGSLSFSPLSELSINSADTVIYEERVLRELILEFLNNGKEKLLRLSSGDNIICVTSDVSLRYVKGHTGMSIISFKFTETDKFSKKALDRIGIEPTGIFY